MNNTDELDELRKDNFTNELTEILTSSQDVKEKDPEKKTVQT